MLKSDEIKLALKKAVFGCLEAWDENALFYSSMHGSSFWDQHLMLSFSNIIIISSLYYTRT